MCPMLKGRGRFIRSVLFKTTYDYACFRRKNFKVIRDGYSLAINAYRVHSVPIKFLAGFSIQIVFQM